MYLFQVLSTIFVLLSYNNTKLYETFEALLLFEIVFTF